MPTTPPHPGTVTDQVQPLGTRSGSAAMRVHDWSEARAEYRRASAAQMAALDSRFKAVKATIEAVRAEIARGNAELMAAVLKLGPPK